MHSFFESHARSYLKREADGHIFAREAAVLNHTRAYVGQTTAALRTRTAYDGAGSPRPRCMPLNDDATKSFAPWTKVETEGKHNLANYIDSHCTMVAR